MNIGIIGDGSTDRQILLKFVRCFIPSCNAKEFYLIRRSFRDSIDKYWSDTKNTDKFWFPHRAAEDLRSAVLGNLLSAFKEFSSYVGGLTEDDILIVSTDAERHLANSDIYFDCWAVSLTKILISGIESFYHTMLRQG